MEHTKRFRLGATGDLLLHLRLMQHAKQSDGSYDFNPQLKSIKHLFDDVDVSIVNQESIIGGKSLGLSDFPKFNSPEEIGYLLKSYGVDLVNIANNHTLDKGEEGLLRSINNWKKIGLPYVGAYESEEDFNTLRVIHKNGLRIGFISISRNLGFDQVIKQKPYLVDQFSRNNVLPITRRLRKIKNKKFIDLLIVSIHFGEEYHFQPSSDQLEIVRSISDAGADVILGHHPHVLQPMDVIFNSKGHDTFTAFSLGNFFTGQKGVFRQIGGFLSLDIEKKTFEESAKFYEPKMTLTFCDVENGYTVRPLKELVEQDMPLKTHMGTYDAGESFNKMKKIIQQHRPDILVE